MKAAEEAQGILKIAGIDCGGSLASYSPIDGSCLGRVTIGDPDTACSRAAAAFSNGVRCLRPAAASSSGTSASGCGSSSRCLPG